MTNTEAIFDHLLREALLPRDLPKAQSYAQCQQVIERRIEMLGGDPLDFDEFRLQQAAAVMWNKLLD